MAWADIAAFLASREPGLPRAVRPVPRDVVAVVERECGVTLPAMYVELLTTLGADAAGYHPFGPTQDHDFYRLVQQLPARYYPGRDYFKVSRCIHADIEPEDHYLDLTRAAGDDTPLVTIARASSFSRDHVRDLESTLAEALTRNAYTTFEVERRPHRAWVFVSADTRADAHARRDLVAARLRRLGLAPPMPPLARVVCLGDGARAAQIVVDEEVVVVDIAGADAVDVQRVVELLLDAVPDAQQRHLGPLGPPRDA